MIWKYILVKGTRRSKSNFSMSSRAHTWRTHQTLDLSLDAADNGHWALNSKSLKQENPFESAFFHESAKSYRSAIEKEQDKFYLTKLKQTISWYQNWRDDNSSVYQGSWTDTKENASYSFSFFI